MPIASLLRLLILAIALLAGSASAQATPLAGLSVERAILTMVPGDHAWQEDGPPDQPVSVVISIPMQMAFVYRGGVLIAASTVSTGRPGKMTPVGEYTILQKKVFHRSNLYNNAPMPYMQRLTWDGIAIHAGTLPGYPASHGCIRLPPAFARRLFEATAIGGTVAVMNEVVQFPAFRPDSDPPLLTPWPAIWAGGRYDAVTGGAATIGIAIRFEPPRAIVQRRKRRRRR